jgi:V/A-type H+/Na+-transporting ATPase subunit C
MGDYGYANARLRAMKGRLFDRGTLAELAGLGRVEDVIAHLGRSPYAPEIDAALARYAGLRAALEGCRLHLAHTYRAIRRFFDEEGARLVRTLLARWDLFNLKTVLRGRQADAAPEDILAALVPAGDLDEVALRSLVNATDARAAADLLRAFNPEYAAATREALTAWQRAGDWAAFEGTLDALFYRRMLATLRPGAKNDELVREYLAREIDAANLLTALRLRRAGGASDDDAALAARFLDGGRLPRPWLVAVARLAPGDPILAAPNAPELVKVLQGAADSGAGTIQDALDRDLARFGIAFFNRDPLSIATAIGYITAKRVEVANVRLIAQGVALGLDRGAIEARLW